VQIPKNFFKAFTFGPGIERPGGPGKPSRPGVPGSRYKDINKKQNENDFSYFYPQTHFVLYNTPKDKIFQIH